VPIEKKGHSGFWGPIRKKVAEIPLTDKQVHLLDGQLGFVIPTAICLAVGVSLFFLTGNWLAILLCSAFTWGICTLAITSFTDIKREDRRERQQRERQPELERQAKEQIERQQAEAQERESRRKAEDSERERRQRIEHEGREVFERQKKEINQLINQVLGIVHKGVSSSTRADDSILLGALVILRQQLDECRAQFGADVLLYEAAKARVAELREQAEVLVSPPSQNETERVSGAQTHYETLGVDRTASQDQIKTAYREKQRRLHPDTIAAWAKGEVPQEVRDFLNDNAKKLNLAYQVLSDRKKRKEYDTSIGRRSSGE
jgi:curved DNA-binding protein CbpA